MLKENKAIVSDIPGTTRDVVEGAISIDGIPAGIEGIDATMMLNDLLTVAKEKTGQPQSEIQFALALGMARGAAIPQGQVLSNDEMENLVNRLFSCSNVNLTPDGKPILCILQQDEIDRLLG